MLPVQYTHLRAKTDLAAISLATDLFANASGLERSRSSCPLAGPSGSWPEGRFEAFAGCLQPSRMPHARSL